MTETKKVHPSEWCIKNDPYDYDGEYFYTYYYTCPKCGETIGEELECVETCPHCGVEFDWGNVISW